MAYDGIFGTKPRHNFDIKFILICTIVTVKFNVAERSRQFVSNGSGNYFYSLVIAVYFTFENGISPVKSSTNVRWHFVLCPSINQIILYKKVICQFEKNLYVQNVLNI